MAKSKEQKKNESESQPERDVFLTVLHAPDRESLARLLREEALDVGPIQARPGAKEIQAHIYVDEGQIGKLKKRGWKVEVLENLTEVGKKRQQEVGEGDRFEGGRIPPKGLGKKTGKEK